MKRRSIRFAALAAALVLLLAAVGCAVTGTHTVLSNTGAPTAPRLAVHYLDVGQADSEFIELPNGKTMLIDAGNQADGDDVVRAVKALGHNTVDILVATHPHADHIGGMEKVVRSLKILAVYMPKVTDGTKTYTDLLKALRDRGLSVSSARAGVTILDEDGLRITLLSPVSDRYDDLNNTSAVVKLVFKRTSFLFMGDAETLSENAILKSGADVKADVLKVGHHGSDTSTGKSFLKAVSPKIAVISVGAGNDYGHPDASTLSKLDKAGTTVYRTDKNGTVTVFSDGSALSVSAAKKG